MSERPFLALTYRLLSFFLITIINLVLIGAWPLSFLIRYINKHRTLNTKPAPQKIIKDSKRQKLYENYQGFELGQLKSEIIERTDAKAKEIAEVLSTETIYFVTEQRNTATEKLIREHFSEIESRMSNIEPDGIRFKFVIPEYESTDLQISDIDEKIRYNFPFLGFAERQNVKNCVKSASIYDFSQQLRKELKINWSIQPGLFRVLNECDPSFTHIRFSYFQLPSGSGIEIEKAIWYYMDHLKVRRADMEFQRIGEPDLKRLGLEYEFSGLRFDYDAHKLSKELTQSIEYLKSTGHENILLRCLVNNLAGYDINKKSENDEEVKSEKLSRIKIDRKFRIFLLDYNNIEIKMPALSKALFLLFLRHPEGIILKHLSDHETELLEIYRALSLRESFEEANSSIKDLINPLSNSVNEKASRIKSAFVTHFSESLAINYHITGKKGYQKQIILDRSLVNWEVVDLTWPFLKSKSFEQSLSDQEIISKKYDQALVFIGQKKFDSAISLLTEIIHLNKSHFAAFSLRATCQFEMLHYSEAEKDNTAAIKLNPDADIPYYNRSEARLMLGKYDDALKDINKYLTEVDNESAESYYIRGLIYFETGSNRANQDFVNAKCLGHEDADRMLKQCSGRIPSDIVLEKKLNA